MSGTAVNAFHGDALEVRFLVSTLTPVELYNSMKRNRYILCSAWPEALQPSLPCLLHSCSTIAPLGVGPSRLGGQLHSLDPRNMRRELEMSSETKGRRKQQQQALQNTYLLTAQEGEAPGRRRCSASTVQPRWPQEAHDSPACTGRTNWRLHLQG